MPDADPDIDEIPDDTVEQKDENDEAVIDAEVVVSDEDNQLDPKKISPPLLKRGNSDSRPHKNNKKLKPPKGVHQASVEYTILNKIHSLSIQSEGSDAASVATAILEHYNTAKSPEDFGAIVQKYMNSGYIELQESSAGTFDLAVNSALVSGQAIESLKFDYDRQVTVEVDSKDIKSFALEDLILTRMLQMETYSSSGVPQEKALKNFILLAGREASEGIDEILAKLRSDGRIEPNGDKKMHLTNEGLQHIMFKLHTVDSLFISKTKPPEKSQKGNTTRTRPTERALEDNGVIILGPSRRFVSRALAERVDSIEQKTELPTVSADILQDLKNALKAEDDDSIDTEQVVLDIGKRQEAALIVAEMSEIINDGLEARVLPRAINLFKDPLSKAQIHKAEQIAKSCTWRIDAFVDSTTVEFIPVTFSIQKLYNAEALALASGLAANIVSNVMEFHIIGNKITINFRRDITIKDILGIARMDNDLEELYVKSDGRFELNSGLDTKSGRIMHSGLNGLVNMGTGKLAYYPDVASGSEWVSSKLDETLLAQSE